MATTAAHPPFSQDCQRSRAETRWGRVSYAWSRPSIRPIARRISSSFAMVILLLSADEGHWATPIVVTQLTQRTDLELIGSGRRQAGNGRFSWTGQRQRGPGTGRSA